MEQPDVCSLPWQLLRHLPARIRYDDFAADKHGYPEAIADDSRWPCCLADGPSLRHGISAGPAVKQISFQGR